MGFTISDLLLDYMNVNGNPVLTPVLLFVGMNVAIRSVVKPHEAEAPSKF